MPDNLSLKPCPFCGSEADIYTPTLPMAADCDDVYVRCGHCDAMGPAVLFDQDTHDADDLEPLRVEAIAAWNRRPSEAAPQDVIERVAEAPINRAVWRCIHCDHDRHEPYRNAISGSVDGRLVKCAKCKSVHAAIEAIPSYEQGIEDADTALLSACYIAMRDAMTVIGDPDERPTRERYKILNALANARVEIERRSAGLSTKGAQDAE